MSEENETVTEVVEPVSATFVIKARVRRDLNISLAGKPYKFENNQLVLKDSEAIAEMRNALKKPRGLNMQVMEIDPSVGKSIAASFAKETVEKGGAVKGAVNTIELHNATKTSEAQGKQAAKILQAEAKKLNMALTEKVEFPKTTAPVPADLPPENSEESVEPPVEDTPSESSPPKAFTLKS
jgi:hypothetical protein